MDTQLFFETHGEKLLRDKGLSKTEFAEKMGIKKQNVNILFQTKNIVTLRKAAEVLDVPFELLVGTAKSPVIEVTGYLEINGDLRKIRNKDDLMAIVSEIQALEDK